MRTAPSQIGLFSQDLTLGLSDSNYLVEQLELPPIVRRTVNVTVLPGTVAVIGGMEFKGQKMPYKLPNSIVGSKKATTPIFLMPDKMFDNISISFFGGQHVVSLSSMPMAKAKFSIVGSALVEIMDHRDLANYFNRSMTRDALVQEVNATMRSHLSNEVMTAASKYITPSTTEITLRAALNDVAKEVLSSRKAANALMQMGLMLSARGISMHLNALDDAEDKFKQINDALMNKAISSLDNDLLDRAADELAAARKHDVDVILAKNTTTHNNNDTLTTNTNGNAPVVISKGGCKNGEDSDSKQRFCMHCGAKLPDSGAKFCPACGRKL